MYSVHEFESLDFQNLCYFAGNIKAERPQLLSDKNA